jgi:ATP-dependent protease ClpP protease subunit
MTAAAITAEFSDVDWCFKSQRLYLTGAIFNKLVEFRDELTRAVYYGSKQYDVLTDKEKSEPRTIAVILTGCPGGAVDNLFAICGWLKMFQREMPHIKFTLHCCGLNQSCAIALMCCDVFQQVTVDSMAYFLIHESSSTFTNQQSVKRTRVAALQSTMEQLDEKLKAMYANAAARRGKPFCDWEDLMITGENKSYLTAAQMLEYGLCDEILI